MTKEELRSYRLNSMAEPTDEMLEAIMLGVQETARRSTIVAQQELDKRFKELQRQMEKFRQTLRNERKEKAGTIINPCLMP